LEAQHNRAQIWEKTDIVLRSFTFLFISYLSASAMEIIDTFLSEGRGVRSLWNALRASLHEFHGINLHSSRDESTYWITSGGLKEERKLRADSS